VMQGDVTRIVSMNNKERRTLIDELAGVALFDSRIEQTHSKLNDVFERQIRFCCYDILLTLYQTFVRYLDF